MGQDSSMLNNNTHTLRTTNTIEKLSNIQLIKQTTSSHTNFLTPMAAASTEEDPFLSWKSVGWNHQRLRSFFLKFPWHDPRRPPTGPMRTVGPLSTEDKAVCFNKTTLRMYVTGHVIVVLEFKVLVQKGDREGEWLTLDILLNGDFPYSNPLAFFHKGHIPENPHVCKRTGRVCLDVVGENYEPIYSPHTVVICIRQIFAGDIMPTPREPFLNPPQPEIMED